MHRSTSMSEAVVDKAIRGSSAEPGFSYRLSVSIALTLLLNSVLRGIRAPAYWGGTHLLFNYHFGFAKRALLGALIASVDAPYLYHYSFYFSFSVAIFAGNLWLIIVLLRRLCRTGCVDARVSVLVFCSSLAVVFLAHTIGWPDQIVLLVTLVLLLCRNFYARALLTVGLFGSTLLIHEGGFLSFFPAVCLRFIADLADRPDRIKMIILSALVVIVTATVLVVGTRPPLSTAAAAAMQHTLQSKADFPLNTNGFLILTRTFSDNLEHTVACTRQSSHLVWFLLWFLPSMIVTLPTTIYLLCRAVVVLVARGYGLAVRAAAIGAGLSPLSLHFLGCDNNRWFALATTSSFLVFSVTHLWFPSSLGAPSRRSGHGGLRWAIALIALNLGSAIALFSGYEVQDFPYEGHVADVAATLEGQAPFPPRPEPLRDTVLHN
jgi:hypothetical protein